MLAFHVRCMEATGFFWGRMNPPHKGHIRLIKKILERVDNLIIVVGASQYENTKRNPFSGYERKKMFEAYLKEEGVDIDRVMIIPLPDIEASIEKAVRYVIRNVPRFNVAFSTHELKEQRDWTKDEVDRIFAEEMKKRNIRIVKFRRTGTLSSTKIGDAIAYGNEWEHLTGKSVAEIIKGLDGINRIKDTYKQEESG
jgi:nicotinamide-nucleotide adenylyltransferase